MGVVEKGFLNNAKGIKVDDWVDEYFKNSSEEDIESLSEFRKNCIDKSIIKNGGVRVQLENWSDDNTIHVKNDVVAVYPISLADVDRGNRTYPTKGKSFRCAFKFTSGEEAKTAFDNLVSGEKSLLDYASNLEHPDFKVCLGGDLSC